MLRTASLFTRIKVSSSGFFVCSFSEQSVKICCKFVGRRLRLHVTTVVHFQTSMQFVDASVVSQASDRGSAIDTWSTRTEQRRQRLHGQPTAAHACCMTLRCLATKTCHSSKTVPGISTTAMLKVRHLSVVYG